jgi:hypothetical protein
MFTYGKLLCASTLLAAVAWSGCGGSEESSLAGDDRLIPTLSQGERQQVITRMTEDIGAERLDRAPARLVCLATTALVGQCDDARLERCVDDLVRQGEPGLRFSYDISQDQCGVTVGDLAQCVHDFHAELAELTCENAGRGAPEPESCGPVRQRCAEALSLDLTPERASDR